MDFDKDKTLRFCSFMPEEEAFFFLWVLFNGGVLFEISRLKAFHGLDILISN